MAQERLTRSETDRMVAGVCGGLAEFFGIDSTLVRLLFVLFTWLGGGGVLVYLAMWALVPRASQADAPSGEAVRENVAEGRRFAEDATRRITEELGRLRGMGSSGPGGPGRPPSGSGQPPDGAGRPPPPGM